MTKTIRQQELQTHVLLLPDYSLLVVSRRTGSDANASAKKKSVNCLVYDERIDDKSHPLSFISSTLCTELDSTTATKTTISYIQW